MRENKLVTVMAGGEEYQICRFQKTTARADYIKDYFLDVEKSLKDNPGFRCVGESFYFNETRFKYCRVSGLNVTDEYYMIEVDKIYLLLVSVGCAVKNKFIFSKCRETLN